VNHRAVHMYLLIMLVLFVGSNSIYGETSHAFDAEDRFSNLRTLAMGSAGIALFDSGDSFYKNPAALYRNPDTQFKVGLGYADSVGDDGSPIPWIQQPEASMNMLFSNRYVALSIGLGNILQKRELSDPIPADREHYAANNLSRIQLTAAYGWEAITFGFYARGGTMTERNVTIHATQPLFDYITQTYLDRYEPAGDSGQLFASGFGVLLSYQWISIGLLTNSLFLIDESTNELKLEVDEFFNKSALGLAVTTPKFDRNNELNRLVALLAFDIVDIGDAAERSVRIGFEGKIQFLSDFWIALRSGYREIRPLGEALFSFEANGELSAGIGGQLGLIGVDVAVTIPLDQRAVSVGAGISWKL